MPPSGGDTGGTGTTCASCGRPTRSGEPCPHCGHKPAGLGTELAKLDKALSEMAAANLDLDRQRKDLVGKMQAAKHQRDVLARALSERVAATGRTAERTRRLMPGPRRPGRAPPAARRPAAAGGQPVPKMRAAPAPEQSTEASSGSVQALMLGLGALLLGIAAVVFVGVAITVLDVWGQLAILVGAAAVTLSLPPPLARRGLVSTAETISAVGLVLVGVVGYALWATGVVPAVPVQTFASVVAAVTAAAGYGYHRLTGLAVPRSGGLLAAQPVLPLLFYPVVSHPAGWAAVFTLVAVVDGLLGRLDRDWPAPLAGWQRHLAWVLHGLALGAGGGYAITALALAGTVPDAARAGSLLVAAAAVGVGGTLILRQRPLPDLAAGLMTIAIVVSAARVAVVAVPDRTLLLVSVVVAATGLAGRSLPATARRGPQLASAAALALLGTFVTALAVRAGIATVVLPPWPAEVSATAVGTPPGPLGAAGWQLAVTAAVLTVAAVVALPPSVRREGTAVGVALTAVAAPASFGLGPPTAAWLLVVVAAGLSMAGKEAATRRAAVVQLAAAVALAVTGVGAALASPVLTAAILAAVTVTGAVVATGPGRGVAAETVSRWAAGGAVLALPGATATAAAAAGTGTSPVLAMGSAGACVSLGYAVKVLLVQRTVAVPITVGAGTGAAAVAVAAVAAGDAATVDIGIAALLTATGALIYFTPRIDETRRRDRLLDGADLAAAALTAGVVASLARITWLVLPLSSSDAALFVAGLQVGVVALAVRALPARVRRGPVLGVALSGALVASVAAAAALTLGARVIGTLWQQDLTRWPPPQLDGLTWGAPVTLLVLAAAAAAVLPQPRERLPGRAHVSATLAVLAVIATPVPLGLDWWWPAALAAAAGTCYAAGAAGLGRWLPVPPRVARAHAGAAGALALYAVGASVARPWTIAVALGGLVLVGTAVAAATATLPGVRADPRLPIGGGATTGVLLALPGALAALAVHLGHAGGGYLAALGGCGLGLAALAALTVRRGGVPDGPGRLADAVRPYLPYGTVGVVTGATAVAVAAMPTTHPAGVYAAAAVLLAVTVELLRADPTVGNGLPSPRPLAGWVNPSIGALLAAAVPTTIALIQMAPALRAALVDPFGVLAAPWQGPPPELLRTGGVPATSALAALLLTLAAALAAAGFGGAVTRQSAPVVAPGLAITLLISPAALGAGWPAGTVAALVVFTVAMLGVALTPPPRAGIRTRVLRWARGIVLVIGLAAGGAGLAGSLADQMLTWGTFGGAVAVGATAALGGRTRSARLLGWLGAALAADLFALTTASLAGATRHQAAMYLLPIAAVALLLAARLPKLRMPAARPELATVEWLGGYLTLLLALGLAYGSPPDVAALLAGTGMVLGADALRPDRPDRWRRGLLWAAAASETGAVWIVVWLVGAQVLEAYTLPLAAFALLVGWLETRRHPQLTSWVVLAPGIVAALVPSLFAVVTVMEAQPLRQAWVLLGGVGALVLGSRRRQRAPVILGSAVTAAGALHLLSLGGPLFVLLPLGVLLLYLGGKNERRRRELERIRGALDRMR
jgi:hypothetical protein